MVEAIGHTGHYDYVEFVAEYAPFDLHDLDNLGRAGDLYDLQSLARAETAGFHACPGTRRPDGSAFPACTDSDSRVGGWPLGRAGQCHQGCRYCASPDL